MFPTQDDVSNGFRAKKTIRMVLPQERRKITFAGDKLSIRFVQMVWVGFSLSGDVKMVWDV